MSLHLQKPNVYKGRKNAQDAHEAIRPTYIENTPDSIKQYLTSDQYKLYKLIYTLSGKARWCPRSLRP